MPPDLSFVELMRWWQCTEPPPYSKLPAGVRSSKVTFPASSRIRNSFLLTHPEPLSRKSEMLSFLLNSSVMSITWPLFDWLRLRLKYAETMLLTAANRKTSHPTKHTQKTYKPNATTKPTGTPKPSSADCRSGATTSYLEQSPSILPTIAGWSISVRFRCISSGVRVVVCFRLQPTGS